METYLTGDLERADDEDAKSHYNRIYAIRVAADFELSRTRCVTCASRDGSKCTNFHADIGDYMYEPNECEAHQFDIPF